MCPFQVSCALLWAYNHVPKCCISMSTETTKVETLRQLSPWEFWEFCGLLKPSRGFLNSRYDIRKQGFCWYFIAIWQIALTLPSLFSTGCFWLCGHISKECLQHPHRVPALHVHLRSHCCAALQGEILLLYWQLHEYREGMPVSGHI